MARFFRRRRFCRFTAEGVKQIDYKDVTLLKNYITDNLYDITEYHSHLFECILENNDTQTSKYKNKVNMFFYNYHQMISNLS